MQSSNGFEVFNLLVDDNTSLSKAQAVSGIAEFKNDSPAANNSD
jgi:hypothetical protein